MKTKPKRVKPFVKLWVDGDECHAKRPSAGFDYIEFRVREDQVPALIEQLCDDCWRNFCANNESENACAKSDYTDPLKADLTYALKRAGITAGRKR